MRSAAQRSIIRKVAIIKSVILSCMFIFMMLVSSGYAAKGQTNPITVDPFPVYPTIKPNVDFWIDIFTKYSKSDGVIHDIDQLNIVYEVIKLDPSETRASLRKNKRIKDKIYKKYKTILLSLSNKNSGFTKEEKRVRDLFGSNVSRSVFKKSASRIRCQTGLKKEFKEGLIRSGAVIDEFKKIFKAHGLPVDLVYLPCVESSFNFKAYSKFGAAGIWQFTRSTGKLYMEIGYVVDERRDPYISTDAAARLLKRNYASLQNWAMALTAYNHGLAGMRRARKSKGSYEKIVQSYQSRSFKFASKNFYSEFLAARKIAKHPDKYFGKINYQKPNQFQTLKTKGYLSISDLSGVLNISAKAIGELNPSLRTPVLNGQKYIPAKFHLRLPKNIEMADLSNKITHIYYAKQKPSQFHRVQKGDTAGSIARLHSVKLNDLMLANGLNRRATIYIGQNLRIPVKDEKIPLKQSIAAASTAASIKSKKSLKKESLNTDLLIDKPKTILSKPAKISERAPQNTTKPKPVLIKKKPAQKPEPILTEPIINPLIVTADLKILKTYIKKGRTVGLIKVEAEETLGHYADWLKITTQSIRVLNRFKFGTSISMEQTIEIPLEKGKADQFEVLRYEYHKEIEEDFFESFSVQDVETYIVKSGDNIWSVCFNELELPIWLVKKYNPDVNFKFLYPNQMIQYPVITHKDDMAQWRNDENPNRISSRLIYGSKIQRQSSRCRP